MVTSRIKNVVALIVCVCAAALSMQATRASASDVVALVHLSAQRMDVLVDGQRKYTWRVSTGRDGWRTKAGTYYPFAQTPFYFSKKWNMALPYLISIGEDGTAIHGTALTGHLGSPASHGCIRLDTSNAARLYQLVSTNGMSSTKVVVIR